MRNDYSLLTRGDGGSACIEYGPVRGDGGSSGISPDRPEMQAHFFAGPRLTPDGGSQI